MRRVLIGLGVAVLALAGLAALAVAFVALRVRERDVSLERALEPFYRPPEPLPPGRPGDLIRAEAIAGPAGVRAWRVLYRSTTFREEPVAVSAMIAVPDGPPPPGGFPVVVVAHGTVGTARICAPSLRPFQSRSVLPRFLTPDLQRSTFYDTLVRPFIDAGYAVTATDYRGMGTPQPNPYLIGDDEARNVLDSARLIRRFPEVTVSEQMLIWGQSQGGHAAAFAGQNAPRYAPELRVLGIVLGAPAPELQLMGEEIARVRDRSALVGLFATIVYAWTALYPDLEPEQVMTARGVRTLPVVGRACVSDVLLAFSRRDAGAYINDAGIGLPQWQARLAENSPGAVRSPAPLRVFQGTADEVIRPEFTDAYVRRICGLGDVVAYQLYPGLGHINSILPSMPATLAWMADRLAGRPAPNTC